MLCPQCTGKEKGVLRVLRIIRDSFRIVVCDREKHFFKVPLGILMSQEGPVPTDLIYSPRSEDSVLRQPYVSDGDSNELQQLPTVDGYREVLGLPPSVWQD